jgi:ribose-phosphate pyrophosphokinase
MLPCAPALSLAPPPKTTSSKRLRLISGTANTALAQEVARSLGVDLTPVLCKRFADGEIYVQVQESIRGCEIFLIQPTCGPVNDYLMELMVLIDACRRASARQITAVIPYYCYARADRKTAGRESITAKLVANLITEAGADRVLALDVHSAQVQGFFDISLDHLQGAPILADYVQEKRLSDVVVVSPDIGGVSRARTFAKRLHDAPLAIVDKRRQAHNQSEVMNVIGDVKGKTAILVDDMIDTAGTISEAAKILRREGASRIYVCATHALFSHPAIERLLASGLEEVIVTNTIPISEEKHFPQLKVLSVATLLGEAIFRIHTETSVSSLVS